ncbi:MAG: hypothetical protein QOE83_953 [Actinomycetota bacterium]|jgi:hypothetical protein|nr:hypothetical protein [Actinomycetota bacterium]
MNEYLVRFTGERLEDRVFADTYAHDLFDVVFLVGGEETRRVAVAEIADVQRVGLDSPWLPGARGPFAADGPELLRAPDEESPQAAIQPPGSSSQVGRSSRSGPRFRYLPIAGHDDEAHGADEVR